MTLSLMIADGTSSPPPVKRCHDVSIVGNCVVGGEGGGGGGVLCESFPEQLWTAQ